MKTLWLGVALIVTLLGGLTLLGFFDWRSPYFELATLFRLQYAVLLGMSAFVAILGRRFSLALVAVVLASVNFSVIARVPSAPEAENVSSPTMRLLLINVEYGNQEYDRVTRLIEDVRPDVVGLTELTPAWVRGLEPTLSSYHYRQLAPEPGAYGIGLYSRIPLEESRVQRFPSEGPPSIVATITVGERPIGLVITHVHTPFAGSIHDRQLDALASERQTLEEQLAVCGDFNDVPWSQPLHEFAQKADLRSIHGRFGLPGTWPSNAPLFRIPIDNCFVSEHIAVIGNLVGPDIGSDHLPLTVDLAPGSTTIENGA